MNRTSLLSDVTQIFENVAVARINRHEIECLEVGEIIRASNDLFRMLDRSDSVQLEASRRLWVLRSSILFSLLPFDSDSLALRPALESFVEAYSSLPDSTPIFSRISSAVESLIRKSQNPKGEWVRAQSMSRSADDLNLTGLLRSLSAGKTPGWPIQSVPELDEVVKGFQLVGSRKEWRSSLFGRFILPCACRNVSTSFLEEIIYSGRTRTVEVLLYSEEKFFVPRRIRLPNKGIFKARVQKTTIEQESQPVAATPNALTIEAWANEAFWQGLHGATNTAAKDLVSANYVLFCDGSGTFLPESGRALTLPSSGVISDASELKPTFVTEVNEGDFIVFRSGASGSLLDETSDRIMSGSGEESLAALATDWKDSLEALLISHSYGEVVQALHTRGVNVTAATIRHWAGPDVLGPGDGRAFEELILMLAEKGKLRPANIDLQSYIKERWKNLRHLRSIRHKAGNLIRSELFETLFARFQKKNQKLSDKESIRIGEDAEVELLVLRVSSVDRNPSLVNPSRLYQVEDLRGNKWLG